MLNLYFQDNIFLINSLNDFPKIPLGIT